MISTCINNFKQWTSPEQLKVKTDYLNGKAIDNIAQECQRHENTVCIELIRQDLLFKDSPENVASRHTRFEYGHFDNATDSDEEIESEYDAYDLNEHFDLLEYLYSHTKNSILRFFSLFV